MTADPLKVKANALKQLASFSVNKKKPTPEQLANLREQLNLKGQNECQNLNLMLQNPVPNNENFLVAEILERDTTLEECKAIIIQAQQTGISDSLNTYLSLYTEAPTLETLAPEIDPHLRVNGKSLLEHALQHQCTEFIQSRHTLLKFEDPEVYGDCLVQANNNPVMLKALLEKKEYQHKRTECIKTFFELCELINKTPKIKNSHLTNPQTDAIKLFLQTPSEKNFNKENINLILLQLIEKSVIKLLIKEHSEVYIKIFEFLVQLEDQELTSEFLNVLLHKENESQLSNCWFMALHSPTAYPKALELFFQLKNQESKKGVLNALAEKNRMGATGWILMAHNSPTSFLKALELVFHLQDRELRTQVLKTLSKKNKVGNNSWTFIAQHTPDPLQKAFELLTQLKDRELTTQVLDALGEKNQEGWNSWMLMAQYAPTDCLKASEIVATVNDKKIKTDFLIALNKSTEGATKIIADSLEPIHKWGLTRVLQCEYSLFKLTKPPEKEKGAPKNAAP